MKILCKCGVIKTCGLILLFSHCHSKLPVINAIHLISMVGWGPQSLGTQEWPLHLFCRHKSSQSLPSCPTLWPHGLYPARLCPWDSPGKNTGVGCHFLLQGISPTVENIKMHHGKVSFVHQDSISTASPWRLMRLKFLIIKPCLLLWWLRANPGLQIRTMNTPREGRPQNSAISGSGAYLNLGGKEKRWIKGIRYKLWKEHATWSGKLILLKWTQANNLTFSIFSNSKMKTVIPTSHDQIGYYL